MRTSPSFISEILSGLCYLASSQSLRWLVTEGSALRSKKRLMGELISSGFYRHNHSWLLTLSGSQANEEADWTPCVRAWVYVCASIDVATCIHYFFVLKKVTRVSMCACCGRLS